MKKTSFICCLTFEVEVEINIAFGIKIAVDLFSISSMSANAITNLSLFTC
jgi:hypothetical protein